MRRAHTVALGTLVGLAASFSACENTEVEFDAAGNDAGTGNDVSTRDATRRDVSKLDSSARDVETDPTAEGAAEDASMDGAGDEVAGPVNGCMSFDDFTGDGGVITGPATSVPSPYVPSCVQIKAGESVTWTSDFTDHPLEAFGGTTPTPIVTTASGASVTFAFATVGTYGYHCSFHPFMMFGAVDVVP